MTTKTRQGVFETNSSSTHSFTIAKQLVNVDNTNLADPDNVIRLEGGEFGWEWADYTDSRTKANYLFATTQYLSENNMLKCQAMLKEVLIEATGCLDVEFSDVKQSSIDHESEHNGKDAFTDKETLKRAIFETTSILHTGNDNSNKPSKKREHRCYYYNTDSCCYRDFRPSDDLGDWDEYYNNPHRFYADKPYGELYEYEWEKLSKKDKNAIKKASKDAMARYDSEVELRKRLYSQLATYQNGNSEVTLYRDGTKVRTFEGDYKPIFPESIDVKITDYCNLGCKYCHESSTTNGLHGDLAKLKELVELLPAGVELAIGGGNPLDHPNIKDIVENNRRLIYNVTVNQGHLGKYWKLIDDINYKVTAWGVSITANNYAYVRKLLSINKNVVFHLIAGVNTIDTIKFLSELTPNLKVLVLGYKEFGFGNDYFSEEVTANLATWKAELKNYLSFGTISFDNLALEQLDVKSLVSEQMWRDSYMGEDGQASMYIDCVNQEFAKTSRTPKEQRVPFSEMDLFQFFQSLQK